MPFFKQFPKLPVDINRDGVIDISTDFWRYVDIVDEFADDSFAYKKVRVPNEVRPDQLSNQLYGTPDFYWTFFILNDFLKDGGINAWAKGDQELDTYIKDAHDRFAILVFPPVDDPNDSGQYNLIDGMPINDADYKDQLYLLFDIGDSQETYAAVKIVHWDQSRYQLWVDKTQMYEYTPEEPGGASEGPDLIVKTESHFNTFFTLSGDGYKEFHVRYLDNPEKIGFADSEFDSQYELGSDFDSDYTAVKQTAWQTALSDLGYSTSEEENSVYAYQIFTDAERAPYEYYSDDSEGIIRTAYDALNDDDGGSGVNSNFISYYDHEVEENDAAREVRVLRSDRVREFAKEFKALLNK